MAPANSSNNVCQGSGCPIKTSTVSRVKQELSFCRFPIPNCLCFRVSPTEFQSTSDVRTQMAQMETRFSNKQYPAAVLFEIKGIKRCYGSALTSPCFISLP